MSFDRCAECKALGPLVLLERDGLVRPLCLACAAKQPPPPPEGGSPGCQSVALVVWTWAVALVAFALGFWAAKF